MNQYGNEFGSAKKRRGCHSFAILPICAAAYLRGACDLNDGESIADEVNMRGGAGQIRFVVLG